MLAQEQETTELVKVGRVLALAVLWGSNFYFIAVALQSFGPGTIAFARLAFGANVLLAIARSQGLRLPRRALWVHLVVAAVIANVAPYFLFAWAEQRIASSTAGFLNSITPIMTLVLASLVLRDRTVSRLQGLGVLLGFGGVMLILQPWNNWQLGEQAGGLAVLLASLCYAISYIYMARHLTDVGSGAIELATGQMIFAAILSLPLVLLDVGQTFDPQLWPMLSLVILGGLGTGIAFVLNYTIIESDGPTVASTVLYLLPVVAGLLGWLLLNETVPADFIVGTALVLFGVFFTRRRPPEAA